jgi:hypothetical protein
MPASDPWGVADALDGQRRVPAQTLELSGVLAAAVLVSIGSCVGGTNLGAVASSISSIGRCDTRLEELAEVSARLTSL